MLSLLTATAARMEKVSKRNISDQHTARQLMTHAIPHIRRYLRQLPRLVMDKQLILDIFYLSVCEWYLEDYQSALTHLRAVGNLMASLEPGSPFDDFIKETVCYNDIFLAMEMGSRPLFPLDWDLGDLSPERRLEISQSLADATTYCRMGRGFSDPQLNHIFSPEMKLILCDLVLWIDVGRYTWQTRTAPRENSEWACRKGQAFLHRLLSVSTADCKGKNGTVPRLREECVRLSLIILLSFLTTQTGWRSGNINASKLRTTIETDCTTWGSPSLDRMRMWVLISGALGVSDNAELEKWYLGEAAIMATGLKLRTYDDLCRSLSEYLYSPRFQRDILQSVERRLVTEEKPNIALPEASAGRPRPVEKQTFGFNLSSGPGRMLW